MTSSERRPVPLPLLVVGLAALYAALYELIVASTAFDSTLGAAFWPAAGVTVVVLLRRERRDWPWLLAAIFVTETAMDIRAGFSVEASFPMGLANAVEPAFAAFLLRRGGRSLPDLTRRDDLLRFILFAVIAGPALGALVGSTLPALMAGDPVFPRLPRWFEGDAVGVLVVAPAVKLLTRHRPGRDTIAPLVALAVVTLGVLGPWEAPAEIGLPFLVLPALAVVAIRLGPVGASAGVLLVAIIVETTAAANEGPFAHDGPFGGLVVVQMFLTMASLTSLSVGVLVHDLVSRAELEETLRTQALHDDLTGLPNRRLLFDRLTHANQRLERSDGLLALFYIDLDRFKAINDHHGHEAGDHVLQQTASRLQGAVRAEDTVARIGGDEFVVLSEGQLGAHDVEQLAARLSEVCEAPIPWNGEQLRIGASIGVSVTHEPVAHAERLLATADRAMYGSKHAGGRRSTLTDSRRSG